MVGIVIVSHGHIGRELLDTARFIIGQVEGIVSVGVDPEKRVEDIRAEISEAIAQVDQGQGVLIVTDMFGGTPSNLSLSFLMEGKVEVLSGVNLPMVLKLASSRNAMGLSELAQFIRSYGQKNISLASEILGGKKNVHNQE